MSKSKARFLAELLNDSGRVKKDKSQLTGGDNTIDLDSLPTITNAKLQNSSISIAGHSTALGGSVSLNTGDITEHTDYKYYTDTRVRAAVSITDSGGDGSLAYNSSTGVITYTGPSAAEVRAHITASTGISITDGAISTASIPNSSLTNSSVTINSNSLSLGGTLTLDTDDVGEGSTNLYYTDARVGSYLSTNSYATQSYVGTQIANLVDSAPGTLNTLNELAAALGDDANFSTTVTNSIATKLPLAGGTLTGTLNYRMLSSQTTSNLDTAGDSSGFSVFYGTSSATSKPSGTDHSILTLSYNTNWQTQLAGDWRTKNLYYRTQENGTWKSWATMWHSDNDGTGSGLDADLLDGYHGSNYIGKNGNTYYRPNTWIDMRDSNGAGLYWGSGTGSGWHIYPVDSEDMYMRSGSSGASALRMDTTGTARGYVYANSSNEIGFLNNSRSWRFMVQSNGTLKQSSDGSNFNVIWHAGNDGSGSGLDADLLDGLDSGIFFKSQTNNHGGWSQSNRNFSVRSGGNAVGLHMEESDGTFGFQLYGDGSNYGFLDGEWANWDIQKVTNGKLYLNGNTTYFLQPEAGDSAKFFRYVQIGDSSSYNSNSGTWGARLNVTDDVHAKIEVGQDANSMLSHWYAHTGHDSIKFGTASAHDVEFQRGGTTRFEITSGGTTAYENMTFSSGRLRRGDHHLGHLEGSYNNVGANSAKTNPIYTIGSNYNPSSTSVSGMYGIGYAHPNLWGTSNGMNVGWGMYVVENGVYNFLAGISGTWSKNEFNRNGNKVWDAGNDGSGSGLDADLLDGLNSSQFMRSDAEDTTSGSVIIAEDWDSGTYSSAFVIQGSYPSWETRGNSSQNKGWLHHQDASGNYTLYSIASYTGNSWTQRFTFNHGDATFRNGGPSGNVYYHQGNDGSGSGLDADLLDGQQGSYYQPASTAITTSNIGTQTVTQSHMVSGSAFSTSAAPDSVLEYAQASGVTDTKVAPSGDWYNSIRMGHGDPYTYYSNTIAVKMTGTGVGDIYTQTISNNSAQGWNKHWHANNDGSGSGLDADLLDGKQHTNFGATLATYGTTAGASGRIRCTAPFNTNSGHMFQVTVSLYGSYTCHTYVVSGYMYSTTNQWYAPKAIYTGTGSPDIVVGRDSNGKAYISIANANYMGVRVHNMTMGYQTSVADTYDPWTITVNAATENSVTPTISKVWHSTNDGSGSGLDADYVDGVEASSFLRSDANDTASGQYTFSKTNDHAIRVGTVRGTAVGSLTGEYIHMYERVHIGSPSGWGSINAPQYGLSTYGNCELAAHSGRQVTIGGTASNNAYNSVSSTRLCFGGSNDPANYHIGTNMENYGGNYTKLDLRWHTGIRMGAQPSYGGVRFFDSEDLGTVLFSVGKGDTRTRVETGDFVVANGEINCGAPYLGNMQNGAINVGRTDTNYAWSGTTWASDIRAGFMANCSETWEFVVHDSGDSVDSFMKYNGTDFEMGNNIGWGTTTFTFASHITASGNVTAYSDIKLKENIEVIPNALDKVKQIRGVTFTRNDQEDKDLRHAGVIAQEVEKVLPEVIGYDKNKDIKTVSYGNMVGLLIEAVKELKQEVDDLKAQLKEK